MGAQTFERWLLGIVAALVGMGVVGMWQVSSTVSRLDERLAQSILLMRDNYTQLNIAHADIRTRVELLERMVLPVPARREEPPREPRYALPPNPPQRDGRR